MKIKIYKFYCLAGKPDGPVLYTSKNTPVNTGISEKQ